MTFSVLITCYNDRHFVPAGEILEERRIATRPEKLRRYLAGGPKSRVILETGAEAFWVAEIARECGHDVRVVASMLAPSLGVGRRGLKSDLRDARVLSETSCRVDLPSVHIPRVETRRLQSRLVAMREALVRNRTQLLNVVWGYLRTIGERTDANSTAPHHGTPREACPCRRAAQAGTGIDRGAESVHRGIRRGAKEAGLDGRTGQAAANGTGRWVW